MDLGGEIGVKEVAMSLAFFFADRHRTEHLSCAGYLIHTNYYAEYTIDPIATCLAAHCPTGNCSHFDHDHPADPSRECVFDDSPVSFV